MVRDRFIDGQSECALRRHLNSLGPDTPMADIVDSCRVWESHVEVASGRQMGTDRHSPCVVCQVTEDSQSPAGSPGTESLEGIIRRLLPAPQLPPPKAATIPSDQELLIHRLLGAIQPPRPVVQERSKLRGFRNYATELTSGRNSHGRGCLFARIAVGFSRRVFFLWGLDPHDGPMSDTGSFPFLPMGWQADHVGDKFIMDRGLRDPQANRWETPTDPGRGVCRPDQK